MRPLTLLLCLVLVWCVVGICQAPPAPKKTLTPAQQAYQQQIREIDKQRESLRAEAKQVFEAEMARQKAGACPNSVTTLDANTCYSREVRTTDRNLQAYEEAIRRLTGLQYPDFPGQAHIPGPSGLQLTPAEFDHVEQLWRNYLEAADKAAFHQFDGGTGGPSFEMQTHLRLVRNHMAELNDLNGTLLRR